MVYEVCNTCIKNIGSIDTRVKNLEYYTSLSLLEKDATSVQIQDGSNNDRLKNGIIVDGFYGQRSTRTHSFYSIEHTRSPQKDTSKMAMKYMHALFLAVVVT